MEQNTDPTRLRGDFPMPLARLSQRAAATIEHSGTVEDAQTAISFAALLGGVQRLARRTSQRPIGLKSEILPAETTCFPGQGDRRFAIALHRCLLRCRLGDRGSKLSGAQRSWRDLMTKFQPEVPHPLRDNLPGFLSGGRVTTPAVGVLLVVFIGEYWFKGTPMQVKRHHVGGGEGVLREISEKEFVDHPFACVTDAALFLGCWVGGHDDTAAVTCLPHRDIGAVVELAQQATFWAAELLVSWQVQTALDRLLIQHAVIFAAHDEGEACQIGDDSPCSILSVQPQQGRCRRKMVCLQIAPNGAQPPAQFLPVESIASVSETAEPLVTVGEAQTTVRVRTTSPRLRPV
jgi:hypothetical protein